VAVVNCDSYDQDKVNAAVVRGIELLGGIDQFFCPGERLLLKPNALWGTEPERCVVTHPSVLKAVALLFQKKEVKLVYGDSPAGLQTALAAMHKPGFAKIAEELNMELGDFDQGKNVSFPEGVQSKQLFIANAVFSVDGVISLPKLKTHGLTRMTGAIKNQYGCVPGMVKGNYHARLPDVYEFSRLLVDITRFVKPRLYVMDAIYAMEGSGPQSGDPKKLGVMLFSTDPVAIDSVACRIIDLDPEFVPPIKESKAIGFGNSSIEGIELLGDPLDEFIDKDFSVVRSAPVSSPQSRFLRGLKQYFTDRPVIDKKKCIRCLRCVKTCPVEPKAVDCSEKQKVPVYDYRACIRCFCCHEVCPVKAISIKDPLIKKLFPIGSYISLFISNRSAKNRLVK
jgi:uncharacterized protein (DUF362 family)/Pyruvate/2-oxoacid:ferredoxin oxidoreductase delta subunit